MTHFTLRISLLLLLVFGVGSLNATAAEKLPKVVIIATGGTIAGAAESSSTTAYKAGVLSVEQILASVKGIDKVAEIEAVQLFNIGSQNMTTQKQLELARFIMGKKGVDGYVVTHGTDTMEESAYLLSLLLATEKPVILVGAMRPSTGLGADGPANLYSAVVAAAAVESRGRGAMILMNDDLLLARDAMKFNTIKTNAFRAPNGAPIGAVVNGKAEFFHRAEPRKTMAKIPDATQPLPKVAILYGHVDSDPELVKFLVSEGYKGIVFAGVGHGNTNDATLEALSEAAKSGVAVVRASRVPTGEVNSQGEVDDAKYGFTSSHLLNPAKARVLLQLSLIEARGNSAAALTLFDHMKY